MTRFWLIRHGEPVEQARQRCYGSLDIGLSEEGRAQMARVAEYLATEPVAAIYASPLSRAADSARILAAHASCPVEVVADLREVNFGGFEGLTYDEIAARDPELFRQWMETPTEVRFPDGESFSEMRTRVLDAFARILRERQGQTVAMVSHGGVNRILLAWALQMPDRCLFRLAQDYAALNLLTFAEGLPDAGLPMVQLLNHCPSIPSPPPPVRQGLKVRLRARLDVK
jgi:alpha-ribazole phosphatase/probable phosphoglycerate mutase